MAVRHSTVVIVPDDGVSPVGTDEWNADHQVELANGAILIGNGSGVAAEVIPSGDATISNAGVVSVNKTRLAVRNETGSTIATTKAVYVSGFNNFPLIALADNTDEAKHNVIGLTVGSIADEANGYIATNGICDAETNSWNVGDELYFTTAGDLTTTEPAAGEIKHVGLVMVKENYPTGKVLIYSQFEGASRGVGAGANVTERLGDTAGSNKVSWQDYSGAEIGSLNSKGVLRLAATSDPSPVAGQLSVYAKYIAGRVMPKFVGPSGIDSALQPALFQNRVILWTPGTGTAPLYSGQSATVGATASHPTPATGAIGTIISRTQLTTSTTAGNTAGLRSPVGTILIGDATNRGGFFYNARFNQGSLHTTGVQKMVGLSSSTAALAGEPSSSMADFVGVCLDSGDANWQFSRRTGAGAATKVDLGVAAAANQLWELTMFIVPSGTDLYVRILLYADDGSSTVVLDTSYNTVLPAVTTRLGLHFQVRNGALAAAHNMAMSRIYLESDF